MKLHRSKRNRIMFGVCGGLAETFRIDESLLRLIAVVAALISSGTILLVYLLLALILPGDASYGRGSHYAP